MNERELFLAALEIASDSGRGEYLDAACLGRPEVRRRVEALLQADRDAGSFLKNPAVQGPAAAALLQASPAAPPTPDAALVSASQRASLRLHQDETAKTRPGAPAAPVPPGGGPALPIPEEFGRYRILKLLGQGGMGAVYLARDTALNREVALKIPQLDGHADTSELVARFQREARAAANLHHANICQVYDVGEIGGRHYLTMRYVEGRPLSKFISRDKPQNPRTVAVVVRKLASALEEAHRHGVIHRDLKPANVMMDAKNEPVVMDFGLARQMDAKKDRQLTQSGMIVGTPSYMSPEQIAGDPKQIGPQADVWSLGVIFFELLTGRLPYDGNVFEVIAAIQRDDAPPPSQLRADLPPKLEAVCRRMLARNPSERYATMAEVIRDLNAFLKEPTEKPTSAAGRSVEQASSLLVSQAASPPAPPWNGPQPEAPGPLQHEVRAEGFPFSLKLEAPPSLGKTPGAKKPATRGSGGKSRARRRFQRRLARSKSRRRSGSTSSAARTSRKKACRPPAAAMQPGPRRNWWRCWGSRWRRTTVTSPAWRSAATGAGWLPEASIGRSSCGTSPPDPFDGCCADTLAPSPPSPSRRMEKRLRPPAPTEH